MLQIKPATVDIGGKSYVVEPGVIKDYSIGYEDHGIFGMNVDMTFHNGASHQGTGWYSLGGPWLARFVRAFLLIAKQHELNGIIGQTIYVLRNEPYGLIRGVMDMAEQNYVVFEEFFDGRGEMYQEVA